MCMDHGQCPFVHCRRSPAPVVLHMHWQVWDTRNMSKSLQTAQCGGGVWRLKFHPNPQHAVRCNGACSLVRLSSRCSLASSHGNVATALAPRPSAQNLLLAACNYAGFQVFDLSMPDLGAPLGTTPAGTWLLWVPSTSQFVATHTLGTRVYVWCQKPRPRHRALPRAWKPRRHITWCRRWSAV